MRFRHELAYDAPREDVYEMLADPAFRDRVCDALSITRRDVRITPQGEGMSVSVDQHRPTQGVPGFAKKFIGDEVRILTREEWSGPGGADLHVTIPGKPGVLDGSITLTRAGARTTEKVEGDLKVGVPLIGGKLESLVADLFVSALNAEQKVGRAWLDGDR
jgi:hypothetical protein